MCVTEGFLGHKCRGEVHNTIMQIFFVGKAKWYTVVEILKFVLQITQDLYETFWYLNQYSSCTRQCYALYICMYTKTSEAGGRKAKSPPLF